MEGISKDCNQILSGRELLSLYTPAYRGSLFSQKVIFDPSDSLKKIKEHFGVLPSKDGGNIAGIRLIRDLLYKVALNEKILRGLTITAPHTHWIGEIPVIYSYNSQENIYVIGPRHPSSTEKYIPVSFVFNRGTPLAYEWIDESVKLDEAEWRNCCEVIQSLNNALPDVDLPLGIAIDFRFKASLLDNASPSLETPMVSIDPESKNFSYITNELASRKIDEHETIEQVSWHAISDLFFQFSDKENLILNDMRSYLENFENEKLQLETIETLYKALDQS